MRYYIAVSKQNHCLLVGILKTAVQSTGENWAEEGRLNSFITVVCIDVSLSTIQEEELQCNNAQDCSIGKSFEVLFIYSKDLYHIFQLAGFKFF